MQHQARNCTSTQCFGRAGRGPVAQGIILGMKRKRNKGQQTAGFVLQLAQAQQVLHPFGQGFDRAEQHGAVGFDAQAMGRAMHVQPLVRAAFVGADRRAHARREDFRAAAGQRIEPSRLQAAQDFLDAQAVKAMKEENLHR